MLMGVKTYDILGSEASSGELGLDHNLQSEMLRSNFGILVLESLLEWRTNVNSTCRINYARVTLRICGF